MRALTAFAAVLWGSALLRAESAPAAPPQPVIQMPTHPAAGPARRGCLGDGTGFVRARIRGALDMDVSWKDAELECSGEARPDGSGLRVLFSGPGPGGRVMHLVFGVRAAREGSPGRELPTNLTVLQDGGRSFATRGDDKCTMDQLTQRPLPARGGLRVWHIEGRGFCVAPATALAGPGRILVSRFDFAGRIECSGAK
jgi:hypothetical protein